MSVLVLVLLIGLLYLAFGVLSLSIGVRNQKPLTINEALIWWLPDLLSGKLRHNPNLVSFELIVASTIVIVLMAVAIWLIMFAPVL